MFSMRWVGVRELMGVCVLVCLLVFLGGCGGASESSGGGGSGVSAANGAVAGRAETTPAALGGSEGLGESSSQGTSEAKVVAAAGNEKGASEVPLVKPTAEQLAKWKQTSFEPLQLIEYRENEKTGFVFYVGVTNDGLKYLLGGTKLTLWSVDGKEPMRELIEARTDDEERLLCFAVSPVGDWCAVGDAKGVLRTFDLKEGKEKGSQETKTNAVVKLAISPDGKEIATVDYNRKVMIWDAETLEKKTSFEVDARDVKHLQYVGPQVLIAAGETMSVWETSTGKSIKTFPSQRYQTAVALTPDGKELIFGGEEALQRWNLADDKLSGEYRGVANRSAGIRFSSDGTLVAIATGGGIHILEGATGRVLQVIDAAGSTITDVCWIPQKQILVVGTETGRTRIWGRVEESKNAGLTPLEVPTVAASGVPNEPASVAENMAVIDLRLLPKVPDSKPQSDEFNTVNYGAPAGIDEVKTFYGYVLGERGWKNTSDPMMPQSLSFQKKGHTLNVSVYESKPGETLVNLSYAGNYDLRKTPKLDEFLKSTTYEGPTTVIYKVSANLLQIETGLLKKLHEAGWTAIARLNSSQNEDADARYLEFVKNGAVLNVMVQRDRMDPKLFDVNYSMTLARHALPVPADAGLMEWDGYHEAQMVANTGLSLEEATAFYEEAMKKQGWVAREKGRKIDKEVVYLPYYAGQQDLTIALEPIEGGMVRIRAGNYSQNSWQKPDEKSEEGEEKKEEEEGIEAAEVPILHAAEPAVYRDGDVRFKLEKTPLKELAKEYTEAMKKLGWTAKAFGEPQDDSVGINFEKGEKTLYYRSSIDPIGKGSVTFSGNGLLWTKPIANTSLISYEAWLRNQKAPATLKRLGEYQAEMEKVVGEGE
jgi:WD40 repeat protein